MKYFVIIAMIALSLALTVVPAQANTRAENNKNIAEFIVDTIKLPFVAIGVMLTQDYEKAKKDLGYKEHDSLRRSIRPLKRIE